MTYGNGTATKRLGKRVQQAVKPITPKTKDHVKEAEEESRLRETVRSLQIAHDERYKMIDHYKEAESLRLQNMVADNGRSVRIYPEPWGMPEPVGRRSAYNYLEDKHSSDTLKLAEGECVGFREKTMERFAGRIGWEESFKSNVKQLMVDFKLSSDPSCRLNHLDRMHTWFSKEGKKQVKKETASPNYLTFDKNSQPWPGSVRDIAQPTDPCTLHLAAAIKTSNKKRLELT